MDQEILSTNKRQRNLRLGPLVVAYVAGIVAGAKVIWPWAAGPLGDVVASREVASDSGVWFSHSIQAVSLGVNRGTIFGLAAIFLLVALAAAAIVLARKASNPNVVVGYGLLAVAFFAAGTAAGCRDAAKVANGSDSAKTKIANEASRERAQGVTDKSGTADTSSGRGMSTKTNTTSVADGPFIEAVRREVVDNIKEAMPPRYRGLMLGVVLGDTSEIPPDVEADFKTTGLSHILAVSGLNVSILVIVVGYIVRAATIRFREAGRWAAFIITTVAIVFYMFITGMPPSIIRAGVMGIAGLAAILLSRPGMTRHALSGAALGLLAVDPGGLFDVGFQLSFAATASIIIIAPVLKAALDAPRGGPADALATTIAAQLGVAPILLMSFGKVSLISALSNLVITPAIGPATVLGIGVAATGSISSILSQVLAAPATFCLAYIIAAAKVFAAWPYAELNARQASWWHAAILAVISAAIIGAARLYSKWKVKHQTINDVANRRLARTANLVIAVAAVTLCAFTYHAYTTQPPAGLRVIFLDVGQGDAAIVQAGDGSTILVDGGSTADGAISGLRRYGIRAVDLMVISHPHSDHTSGLPAVFNSVAVKRAIVAEGADANEGTMRAVNAALAENKIKKSEVKAGARYRIGNELSAEVLSPDENARVATAADGGDANNRAIVIQVEYKDIRILFAGDAEEPAERYLIAKGRIEDIDILKVPHHGSKNAALPSFIMKADPEVAVISVGRGNPFHHPAPSTIQRLRQAGAAVYRTDENGDVIIESDGESLWVETACAD